ncbi:hypothetical protein C8R43DRAFT_981291 [Mycena crocata]|nr:hypothetical protein C8R43DRAFT_981291 [Mycena crocata]
MSEEGDLDDTDCCSAFSYDSDDEAPSDSFSLTKLEDAVSACMGEPCKLVKLAEGGYHKVYEREGTSDIVARVAAPAFPKDKVESEVATLKCISARTNIHTPRVHAWNADGANPVGLEYMILEKIEGVPASDVWETLPWELKEVVVAGVADHVLQLFHKIRFDASGSLYTAPDGDFVVGPIIAIPFYRALDGVARLTEPDEGLASYRGPFKNAANYLRSPLEAELHVVQHHRERILETELEGDKARLEQGIRVLEKAIQLALVYPGDLAVSEPLTTPGQPFSLRMDDFRLSNIMIDKNTGSITGLIDFEGAQIAPLWECAYLPPWIQDPDEWDGTYEGGSPEEKKTLRELFMKKIKENDPTGEWIRALERGRPFREFTNMLNFSVNVWADMEKWVDERLEWAKSHPGVGYEDSDLE